MNYNCLDCSHSKDTSIDKGNYCYMFKNSPKNLPCGQHDKFSKQRMAMGKLIIKHPYIINFLLKDIERI
jgi:hypothetical protein